MRPLTGRRDRHELAVSLRGGDDVGPLGGIAVVGIFPTRASVLRLVGMILAEQDDEWQDGRRYFRPETMALIDAGAEEVMPALLMAS